MLNLFLVYQTLILTTSPDVTAAHKGFFLHTLHALGSNYQAQSYYGLLTYLFLASLICGLLATLAYLFSLSATQDSEKRGEYECGFEPFDSATRLPFDVHFYLVGILFLIFDVEIALLLPWVLSLRMCGWFGFYLVLGFVFILGVGFLYEWKRGALIWPARQREFKYVSRAPALLLFSLDLTQLNYNGAAAFLPLFPESVLVVALIALLTYIAYLLHLHVNKKSIAVLSLKISYYVLALVGILYALQLMTIEGTFLVLSGYFIVSAYTVSVKLILILSSLFVLMNTERYLTGRGQHRMEFVLVFLLGVLLMALLVSSNHLFSAFLSLVGFSLNLYVLIMFDGENPSAREAGIKYYYLSTFSSGLLLYGLFLLYTLTKQGRLDLVGLALTNTEVFSTSATSQLQFAILLILVGLFFKMSAFPAHLWAAEVYDGSPSPITTLFMVPVKVAVLGFVLPLLSVGLNAATAQWQLLLSVAAAGSLIWGALGALFEKRTKRFFAYASINQIGFILLGLSCGSFAAYQATLVYIFLYMLMNLILIAIFLQSRRKDGRELLFLTDFRGLAANNWLYSWALALALLSMAGIPPLAGFFGKYYLLLHAVEQELYLLAAIGLATSLMSTYYYLRLIKIVWFEGDEPAVVNCVLSKTVQRVIFAAEAMILFFWILLPVSYPAIQAITSTLFM